MLTFSGAPSYSRAAGTQEATEQLMKGFEAAFEGRPIPSLPDELVSAIAKTGGGSLALKVRQGDQQAVVKALQSIADNGTDIVERLELIQLCAGLKVDGLPKILFKLAEDEDVDTHVRQQAIAAMQHYDDVNIGRWMVAQHSSLNQEEQKASLALLTSRLKWTTFLLEGVDDGTIDPLSVSVDTIRNCLLFNDENLNTAIKERWGDIAGVTTVEMKAEVNRLSTMLNDRSGDVYKGQKLFRENCGKCHKLFIDGGDIGPDLTTYKRDDIPTMVLNVINPNAEIREGFENYIIVTDEGRIITGLMVERDNQVVVLRTAEGQTITVERDSIEESRVLGRSLMPEGLLKQMSDEQIADLFAYLRSTQPLNN